MRSPHPWAIALPPSTLPGSLGLETDVPSSTRAARQSRVSCWTDLSSPVRSLRSWTSVPESQPQRSIFMSPLPS